MDLDGARRLAGPGYPGDVGDAPPALAAALTAYQAAGDRVAVLAELQDTRLLVPVVAMLAEVEYDAAGLAHDKSSDMAAVLMRGADGRLALLAFSSTEAMRGWDPAARPVPVPARTAAQSAVQEQADAVVIDLVGPVTFVVEGDDLRALAAGWQLTRVGEQPAWIQPAPIRPPGSSGADSSGTAVIG